MKNKWMKKSRGAIAVFLSLIMLGMTIFECMLIDTSRIIAAKTVTSSAGDLALNSALTNYDQVLYEVYGLFATAKDEADLEQKITEYFNRTLQGAGIDGNMDDLNNMLKLLVEEGSFELTNVPGSALSNTDVLERQILEFMKFRGPVNIGLGLIEKINAFGDFHKQSDAMEAQLDFEEKLDSLQKACDNVYKQANHFRDWSNAGNDLQGFFLNIYVWTGINKNIEAFEKHILELADLNQKKFINSSHVTIDITDEPETYNASKETNWSWTTVAEYKEKYNVDLLMKIMNKLNPVGLVTDTSNQANEYAVAYNQLMLDGSYLSQAAGGDLNTIQNSLMEYYTHTHNNMELLQEFYALLNHYEAWYSKVGSEETDADTKEFHDKFYNQYRGLIATYKQNIEARSVASVWNTYLDNYENRVKDVYQSIHLDLEIRKTAAKMGKIHAENLLKAIDCGSHSGNTENYCCLTSAISHTKTEKLKWQNKINALPEGNTKTSMQGTFESEASGIDENAYQPLLENAKKLETFFTAYMEFIDSHKGTDKPGAEHVIADTPIEKLQWERLLSAAYDTKQSGGTSHDCIHVSEGMPISPVSGTIAQTIEQDTFYQYLSQICAESEKEEESSSKKDAKDTKKNLFDQGNDKEKKESDGAGLSNLGQDIWTNLEESVLDEAVSGETSAEDTGVEHADDNKKASKNAKKSMNHTKSFLGQMENLLLDARDNLYLTEYAVGMFSCYTTGRKEDAFTIAGDTDAYHKLCPEHNQLYQSEQEYILWGKHDQKTNINHTLMMIYGIRLTLNMVYVFTSDAQINAVTLAWATAIAGWTGFGVPLVQSVLKLALALAESTYDVYQLKDGHDVVLYKTNATWIMKPSNLSKGVINDLSQKLGESAEKTVDNAFNYVDQVTTDKIDKIEESVGATVDEIEKQAIETAVSTILSPFQNKLLTLSTTVNISDDEINAKLEELFQSIRQTADNQTTLGQLEIYILDNCKAELISTFATKAKQLRDSAVKTIDSINVTDLRDKLMNVAKGSDLVNKLGNEVKTKVSGELQNMNEQTQEAVGSFVTEQVSGLLGKVQGSGVAGSSGGTVTSGFVITMNYEEYVHMFLLIKSVSSHDVYLSRIGHLIQLNMSTRNENFKLKTAYTMLELNAGVKVQTSFLGKLDSFLENPVGGKKEYVLKYRGLQGY